MNKKIFIFSILFWLLVIIITCFLKDFLIQIFLDKKYLNVSWSLPVLMIGTAIYSIGQVLIYEIYYYKKPNLLLVSNVLPGIFALVVGFFIIKKYGFAGAVYSNVMSNLISGLITFYTVSRFTRTQKMKLIKK